MISGSWRRSDALLCVLAAALLSLPLLRLATTQTFNYDEVAEFHAIWQVSRGHKPYVDFYYDHPPYFWLLYAPVLRLLPEDFSSLLVLRLLNLVFSFAALALLFLLMLRRSAERDWKGAALGAGALVFLQVPIVFAFSQFRADQLTLALTLAGLLLLDVPAPAPARPRRWAGAGFLFTAGALVTPKLVLICAAAALVHGLERRLEDRRELPLLLGAFLAGCAGAFLLLNLLVLALGIDPRTYFLWTLRHHLLATVEGGYRFGLARGILLRAAHNPLWLLVILGGAFAAARALRERGWRAEKPLLVLLVFAVLQPLWVRYLWEHYISAALLAWAPALALFIHRVGRWKSLIAQAAVAALFLGGVLRGLPDLEAYERWRRGLKEQLAVAGALLEQAPAGLPVSMQPPLHVVFRENSTYFFNYTIIPGGRGQGTEELMARSPRLAPLFTFSGYLEQLERRPPGLILVTPAFAGRQYVAAVEEFLRRHARDYERRDVSGLPFWVRKPSAGGA